jgi:hypothetical protein
MKKPTASSITMAFDYDIGELLEFCGDILEDANEHWIAHALWAANAGETELAKKFLQLSQDVEDAGERTPELHKTSEKLLDEFRAAMEKGNPEEDEDEDEGSEED